MKKLIALTLVIALAFFVLAPLPAFAGAEGRANTAIGLAAGAFLLGVWNAANANKYPQPYPYPYPADTVILPYPAYAAPRMIWPSNCAPQYGNVYDDPYNPGIARYVPTGLMECSWPNGARVLYYRNGQPVPVPR